MFDDTLMRRLGFRSRFAGDSLTARVDLSRLFTRPCSDCNGERKWVHAAPKKTEDAEELKAWDRTCCLRV